MKKKVLAFGGALLVMSCVFSTIFVAACSTDVQDIVFEEEPEEEEDETEPEEDLTGKALNPLTGLYIDEQAATRRPVAVMINNLKKALPQSGIAQADLYYETLAEGDITRILAIFQDFETEKIGPVRSARHYYLDFALDHDAIFVHHGASDIAYSAMNQQNTDNIDGMRFDGSLFWRDPDRARQSGMYEHSSYTNAENIWAMAEKMGYETERNTSLAYPFQFYKEETALGGDRATHLKLPYSNSQISEFVYNEEEGLYYRYQSGEPHIDEITGETLTVKNVIVQFANIYLIAGDPYGRRNVEVVSSGNGILLSNGTARSVSWSKTSHYSPTLWTDAEGDPLTLNRGKTWICVYPQGSAYTLYEPEITEEAENQE